MVMMTMMVTPTGVKKREKRESPRIAPHLRLRTANRYDRGAGRDWVLELLPFFHTHTHSTIESPVHPHTLIRKLDKRDFQSVGERKKERGKGRRRRRLLFTTGEEETEGREGRRKLPKEKVKIYVV